MLDNVSDNFLYRSPCKFNASAKFTKVLGTNFAGFLTLMFCMSTKGRLQCALFPECFGLQLQARYLC